MKKIIPLMLLAAVAAAEPALPLDPKGQVTLSWDKFNELWDEMVAMQRKIEALEKPETALPVPFALSGAAYRGALEAGRARVEAVFSVDVFEPKAWVKVPFLPASAAVAEVSLDGRPFGLIQENGMHTAVVRGAGRHTLRAVLTARAPKDDEAPVLSLPVPQTPMTAVSMFFPRPGLDVTIDGAQGQDARRENGGTRVTAALSPTGALSFRWHQAVPESHSLPRKMYVSGETLFTVSEGALRGRWSLAYTVLHRGAQELAIRLPEGWNVLGVGAEALQEWKVVESGEGQKLLVQFTHPRKGPVQVTIEAERGLADKEDLLPLPRIMPLDVERETGIIAIQAKGSVDVAVPESSGAQAMDPQELPASVWGSAQHPILYAFRHTGKPSLSLSVVRHPDVAVLTTTVDTANALTVLTRRGELVTRVQYQVRNRVKQHLSVALPKGAELWSAFVAGEPVKPTRLPDGAYRLPLRRSGDAGADDVLVEVVYFSRTKAFGFLGRRTVDLPLPDAPVSRAMWSLYLPPESRPLSFSGDVDETPYVPVMVNQEYRRRDASMGGFVAGAMRKAARQLASIGSADERAEEAMNMSAAAPSVAFQSRLLEDSLGKESDGARRSGVFPVYFQIPAEGALHHFGRAMIVGESPKLTFTFAREGLFTLLGWLLIAGLGGLVYRRREALGGPAKKFTALAKELAAFLKESTLKFRSAR